MYKYVIDIGAVLPVMV